MTAVIILISICILNLLLIVWDTQLELKESGNIKRSIVDIFLYVLIVLTSFMGTAALICLATNNEGLTHVTRKFREFSNINIVIRRGQ